eukprot:GFYU01014875.1.p1 GENE.GFYU01014875.1~~GFYU01014875.1.p1  ORF type:complete len:873 (-),score=209.20 GFYU01014875.1:99-2717(-)
MSDSGGEDGHEVVDPAAPIQDDDGSVFGVAFDDDDEELQSLAQPQVAALEISDGEGPLWAGGDDSDADSTGLPQITMGLSPGRASIDEERDFFDDGSKAYFEQLFSDYDNSLYVADVGVESSEPHVQEWKDHHLHMRVEGTQMTTPTIEGYSIYPPADMQPRVRYRPPKGLLLLGSRVRGFAPNAEHMYKPLTADQLREQNPQNAPLDDADLELPYVEEEEEIFAQDGVYEEVFAVDVSDQKMTRQQRNFQDDPETRNKRYEKVGFPPLSPRPFLRFSVISEVISALWPKLFPMFLPLLQAIYGLENMLREERELQSNPQTQPVVTFGEPEIVNIPGRDVSSSYSQSNSQSYTSYSASSGGSPSRSPDRGTSPIRSPPPASKRKSSSAYSHRRAIEEGQMIRRVVTADARKPSLSSGMSVSKVGTVKPRAVVVPIARDMSTDATVLAQQLEELGRIEADEREGPADNEGQSQSQSTRLSFRRDKNKRDSEGDGEKKGFVRKPIEEQLRTDPRKADSIEEEKRQLMEKHRKYRSDRAHRQNKEQWIYKQKEEMQFVQYFKGRRRSVIQAEVRPIRSADDDGDVKSMRPRRQSSVHRRRSSVNQQRVSTAQIWNPERSRLSDVDSLKNKIHAQMYLEANKTYLKNRKRTGVVDPNGLTPGQKEIPTNRLMGPLAHASPNAPRKSHITQHKTASVDSSTLIEVLAGVTTRTRVLPDGSIVLPEMQDLQHSTKYLTQDHSVDPGQPRTVKDAVIEGLQGKLSLRRAAPNRPGTHADLRESLIEVAVNRSEQPQEETYKPKLAGRAGITQQQRLAMRRPHHKVKPALYLNPVRTGVDLSSAVTLSPPVSPVPRSESMDRQALGEPHEYALPVAEQIG